VAEIGGLVRARGSQPPQADLRPLSATRPYLRIRGNLAQLVAEGQAGGEIDPKLDPEVPAGMVIGLIDGILFQHFVDPAAFARHGALRAALAEGVRRMLRR